MANVITVALSRAVNPGEDEVTDGAADGDRQTQVDVERHEDEHQRQTEPQLDEVQQRLKPVRPTQYSSPPAATQTHTMQHTVPTIAASFTRLRSCSIIWVCYNKAIPGQTLVIQRLQLRFDFDSTAVRLLIKSH